MPVRTFGGGASTASGSAPGGVVWGPNFGSTRQFAEEHIIATSASAVATPLLLEEGLLRPWQYQTQHSLRDEGSVAVRELQTNHNLTEESHVALRNMQQTYPSLSDEQTFSAAVFRASFNQNTTWVVPGNLTSVAAVFAWGVGGGGGNGAASLNGGGGGGSGNHARSTGLTVTPGESITIQVPAGTTVAGLQTWFRTSATVMAQGGARGIDGAVTSAGAGGGGASSAQGVGQIKTPGAAGAAGAGSSGGGGAGGAGVAGGGSAGSGSTGGAGGGGGGDPLQAGGTGGNGGAGSGVAGAAGGARGAGGGGGSAGSGQGGPGGRGEIQVAWFATT